MTGVMGSKSFIILSAVLLGQAGLFYGFSRIGKIPRDCRSPNSTSNTPWKNIQDVEMSDRMKKTF